MHKNKSNMKSKHNSCTTIAATNNISKVISIKPQKKKKKKRVIRDLHRTFLASYLHKPDLNKMTLSNWIILI